MENLINKLLNATKQKHLDLLKKCSDVYDNLTREQRNNPNIRKFMIQKSGVVAEAWVLRHLPGATKNKNMIGTDIIWKGRTVEVKQRGGARPDATASNKARSRHVSANIFFEQYSNGNTSATWRDEPSLYIIVMEDGSLWVVAYPELKKRLQSKEIGKRHTPFHANTDGFNVHYMDLLDNGLLKIFENK
jgi:hypothetical protein